ncbi:MAG: hypothetical protein ACREH6_13240 [Geminicoccaceae bacterium]
MFETFLLIAFGLPVLYLAVQLRILARWHGIARKVAALPLVAWGLYALAFAIQVTSDPTSHNLFPFELIIGSVLGLAFLGVCALTRKVAHWLEA